MTAAIIVATLGVWLPPQTRWVSQLGSTQAENQTAITILIPRLWINSAKTSPLYSPQYKKGENTSDDVSEEEAIQDSQYE